MRIALAVALIAATGIVRGQTPQFSGTWKLDEATSAVVATAGIVGLIPAGAPKILHITQSANGSIAVESQINEAHVRIYHPGKTTTTPAGQGGALTVTSKWEANTLISEGELKAPNGHTTTIREVLSIGPGGRLMIKVTTASADTASSTLVYSKISDVGPCESWPTPCKRKGG